MSAPASGAQLSPEAPILLWPSWSRQVAALGLGPRVPLFDGASAFRPSGRKCAAASTVGFAAGSLAAALWPDALTDVLDLPAGRLFHIAPELSSLSRFGAGVGEALACPSPLARAGPYATPPPPSPASPR